MKKLSLILAGCLAAPLTLHAADVDTTVAAKLKTEALDCAGYFHAISLCMKNADTADTYGSLSRNAATVSYRFATADSTVKLTAAQKQALEKQIATYRTTYANRIGSRCENARKLTTQWANTCGSLTSDIEYRQRAWCSKLAPNLSTAVSTTAATPKGIAPLHTTCQGLRKTNWAGGSTQAISDNYRNQRVQLIGQDVACCTKRQRTVVSATTLGK